MYYYSYKKWIPVVITLFLLGFSGISILNSEPEVMDFSVLNQIESGSSIIGSANLSTEKDADYVLHSGNNNTYTNSQRNNHQILEEKMVNQQNVDEFFYDNKYAVIIIGKYQDEEHYQWFTLDAQRQYTLLRTKYNFFETNIYVLATIIDHWNESLNLNTSIIDYGATEENISLVFNQLSLKISENDLLYILMINHGGDTHHFFFQQVGIDIDFWQGIYAHDTYFGLELTQNESDKESVLIPVIQHNNQPTVDNRIFDYELNEYTKEINARRIIFVLQPCFSGGYINDLSGSNRVIITASREPQQAVGPFLAFFYHGLNGSAPDNNHDGRISLGEIYEYSANSTYQWIEENPDGNGGRFQSPLIDDNGDKRGHGYACFWGYDSDVSEKDGFVAARLFDFTYEEI